MTPAQVAQNIVMIGEAWARGRGLRRSDGIAAVLDAVVSLELEMYEEDGDVWWCLKGDREKHKLKRNQQ